MALTTPIAGIPYPELTDVPNETTAFSNMANAIDTQMVARFASAAARDAAIPSPTEGMIHYRSDTAEDRYYVRQGGAWVPINFERMVFKSVQEDRTATTTPTDDSVLKFTMIGGARYRFWFKLFITGNGSTANDFRMALNPPTAPNAVTWAAFGVANTMTSGAGASVEAIGQVPSQQGTVFDYGTLQNGTMLMIHGMVLNGASAGDLALKWSQTTSSATATSILPGSVLRYQRVG